MLIASNGNHFTSRDSADRIIYYENTGSKGNPNFTWITDTLGGVVVNKLSRWRYLSQNGWVDTFRYDYTGYSSLEIGVVNDSVRVLIAGGEEGKVRVYEIADDLSSAFKEVKDYMQTEVTKTKYNKDWGLKTYVAVADLNNDNASDIIIGNERGGLHYLQGNPDAAGIGVQEIALDFKLSPNPTSGALRMETKKNETFQFSVYNSSGKQVQLGVVKNGGLIQLDNTLSNGVYLLKLKSKSSIYSPQRLIVMR